MKILVTENQIKKNVPKIEKNKAGLSNLNKLINLFKNSNNNFELSSKFVDKLKNGFVKMSSFFNFQNFQNFNEIDIPPIEGTITISSKFGPRIHPVTGKQDFHNGIDIVVPSGSNIVSPANGVVIHAGPTNGPCGGYIEIKHEKLKTKYCHVKDWNISPGDQVIKGQIIGYSGGGKGDKNKGRSTGPHLHYTISSLNDEPIDPTIIHKNI